jgi:hypothetical protein
MSHRPRLLSFLRVVRLIICNPKLPLAIVYIDLANVWIDL